MEYDISWLADAGLDIETGLSYTGGEKKYISALIRFVDNYIKNRDRVKDYLEKGDLENYMITVHALKSNARMLGAASLGAGFETLEYAARDGETAVIDEVNPGVMSAYAELISVLAPIRELSDVKPAGELGAAEARQTADSLLASLDDFDDDTSKVLVAKLAGYPFRTTQAEKLRKAVAFIEDFMYDEAADLIKEIYPAIE